MDHRAVAESRLPERPADREIDILRETISSIALRLPAGWKTDLEEQVRLGGVIVDGLLRVTAPDGSTGMLLVEAKRLILTRDVPMILSQLERIMAGLEEPSPPVRDRGQYQQRDRATSMEPLVVARYLAPSTRETLERSGASYADLTGNTLVRLQEPAMFIRDVGAQQDPWRRPGRPRGTLHGPPAARVVRALVDFKPPMSVPDLVKKSRASTGATYRVVDFLDEEGLILRERSRIDDVDWRRLLERWSKDYGFTRSNPVRTYLEPRGLPALVESLRGAKDLQYLVTGSLAAARLAPYAPTRLAMIYVDNIQVAANRLGLRDVGSGANVLLAATEYDAVYERAQEIDGLRIAAPSQIVVDLFTGPGRSPSEAEELMRWMAANEPTWRL